MDDNKRFWEKTAKFYAPIQERSNAALYKELAVKTEPYITDRRVLELCCGSAQITLPLCRKAEYWEATDFSEKMLREAEKRCPSGAVFRYQDATALTYEDCSFDVVIIANALHIMPCPGKALEEIYRVLKPGGTILAPTFIYEGRVNRLRMKLTEAVGFKTFEKWTLDDLCREIEKRGFKITKREYLPADPLPVGFAAAVK